MRRVLLVLGAVAALVAGPACGDDEEALSREEFVEQGNEICREGNDKLEAAFEREFGDIESEEDVPEAEQLASFFEDEVFPEIEGQINDIRDLNPPEAIADDVDEVTEDAEAALDELREQAEDNPEALVESEEDPFEDVNQRLGELGLTACADGETSEDSGDTGDDSAEESGS